MLRSLPVALLAAGLVLLGPRAARADGIGFEYLLAFGAGVLVPVLVFVTVVETWVMARALGAPWREVWRVARDANLWSGLAGFPVSVANASLGALLPDDLHGYFARLPWVSALGYGTQLAATLVVEGLYWRRAQPVRGRPRARWLRGVLLANLATYGVLAPLHYWISRPGVRGIARFERTASWAASPATTIYFVRGADRHLVRVRSDGSGLVELTKEAVADYRISADERHAWVKADAGAKAQELALDSDGALSRSALPAQNGEPPGARYGPTDAQEARLGTVVARAELGLGNRLTVHDGKDELVLLAPSTGFFLRAGAPWAWRPSILSNGREVLFAWGSGLYLLDLDERRVGLVVAGGERRTGSSYTVVQDAFRTDRPL